MRVSPGGRPAAWSRLARFAALTALAGLALGCAGPADQAGTAAGAAIEPGVTITWMASSITQGPDDPRQVLIDAFERAHPEIRVELISGPADTTAQRASLLSALSAGRDTPDVYLGDVIWPAEFASRQLALPLDRYLPADFWRRFVPERLRDVQYRGQTYAAPFYSNQGLLFYRADLLAKAGLTPPSTWEQLRDEAALLRRQGLVRQGFVWQGASYEGLTCDWVEFAADAGERIVDDHVTTPRINTPGSLAALRFLRSLLADQVSPAEVTSFQERQATQMFAAGDVAFMRSWNSNYTSAASPLSAVAGKVGVAPLPAFAGHGGPGYSTFGGDNLYINPKTRRRNASLAFVRWLTDVSAQQIMATQFAEIPDNAAVRADPRVTAADPTLAAAARSRVVGRPSEVPYYPQLSAAVYPSLHAALTGERAPEAALADADRALRAAIAQHGG